VATKNSFSQKLDLQTLSPASSPKEKTSFMEKLEQN
jgi:hypothetical protein